MAGSYACMPLLNDFLKVHQNFFYISKETTRTINSIEYDGRLNYRKNYFYQNRINLKKNQKAWINVT